MRKHCQGSRTEVSPLAQLLRTLRTALMLVAMGCSLPAWAVCNYVETGGQLGTVNSQRVRNGPVITTSANFSMNCGGSLLNLGAPYLRATITSPTTGLTLKKAGTGYSIPYQISTPGGQSYTQGLLILNLNGSNLISLLTNGGANVPLVITTTAGANVPAGVYTDNITLNWDYANICSGIGGGGLCLGTSHTDNTTRTITVELTVTNDCTIAAPDINFGSAPLPSAFPTVSQAVSIVCTRDISYNVGLGPGLASASGRRQMASGLNRLAYDVFKSDGTVWGDSGTARATTTVSDGFTPLVLPYTASVYTDQPPAPVGSYQDTVIVDVQF